MNAHGRNRVTGMAWLTLVIGAISISSPGAEPVSTTPEGRAIAFLSREVPRWSRENRCFSCHNNGDAARALYHAVSRGYAVEDHALAETTGWLAEPDRWDRNGGDGPFSDKRLARVQFAAALAAAHRAGRVTDPQVLRRACDRLVRDQAADGSWPLEGEDEPGSPAAYGRSLATYLARKALESGASDRFRGPIEKADRWLLGHEVETVIDAAVMLMATSSDRSPRAATVRGRSLDLLRKAQSRDGGWGPFVKSPPEVFDTAMALIGLATSADSHGTRPHLLLGRSFLVARQQADGGWIETTRPSGAESYAQRISTSGWATMALLATRESALPAGAGTDPERQAHGR
ncbi:unnamed protein product [uncultured bacterium]|nr:unnamed protein product [uncultured bacterium]